LFKKKSAEEDTLAQVRWGNRGWKNYTTRHSVMSAGHGFLFFWSNQEKRDACVVWREWRECRCVQDWRVKREGKRTLGRPRLLLGDEVRVVQKLESGKHAICANSCL